ncbi:hypothetical protein [Marinicella meishanensis]|uniref:hypothetical protein n=1 Tax=Marinicella meishanensis TaxID=2873263 RepID=UPI001CBB934A|nr:hypothetical protein [Marinicella sp. NBU2979]
MVQPDEKMYIAGILATGYFKVIAYLGDLTFADKREPWPAWWARQTKAFGEKGCGTCKHLLNDNCSGYKGHNQGAKSVVWSFQSSDEQRRVWPLWTEPMGLGRIFHPSASFHSFMWNDHTSRLIP